jgi:hypothetical protein
MIVPNISTEDLKKLPLRAIVALGARCARRVESLSPLPEGHVEAASYNSAIDAAIRLAEDFARGSPCGDVSTVIRKVEDCQANANGERVRETAVAAIVWTAQAAAAAMESLGLRGEPARDGLLDAGEPNASPQLANVAADLAAREAFTAAVDAAVAAGFADDFINKSMYDYKKLLELGLGNYPDAGEPIDPSSAGPLGKL